MNDFEVSIYGTTSRIEAINQYPSHLNKYYDISVINSDELEHFEQFIGDPGNHEFLSLNGMEMI